MRKEKEVNNKERKDKNHKNKKSSYENLIDQLGHGIGIKGKNNI